MIDARELRIGNWLFGHDPETMDHGKNGFFQVDNIEAERINVWRVHGFSDESADGTPIPLTPEVLGKVGFEASPTLGEDYWYINESLCKGGWYKQFVYYIPYNNLSTYCGNVNLQSLHHLQNLYFALTGEELTVNL